ncbi:NAD(P)/FAD-dependent oxidoreductase [Paraburkholderia lycopersici]|uniref:Glycine/D-amino acid oxidase n=1 Tax=Paraburkholderia lycopersici TaxID=416944 RepID=A0A1G6PA62_9BURK|nr:FAD-binding oxidoreductase [Paraburkholderia lycopersici]SDC76969.1 Glycine/D-amino acid oxidase [Paraburkholderia lycopersici]
MTNRSGSGNEVVIVGAGIVGAAAAYYLANAGFGVTVIDAGTPAAGASGASDGAVSVASKKPGPMMTIARAARNLYGTLEREGVLAGLFHTRPTFMFARTEEEMALLALHGEDLASTGETVCHLDRAELVAHVPGLGRCVVAGIAVPGDGHAIGYQIVNRMLRLSHARVVRHAPVRRVRVEDGRAVGVETTAGFFGADAVLIAAGSGSAALAGFGDVLRPRKGQIIITDRAMDNVPALQGPLMSAAYLAAKRSSSSARNPVSLVIDPLRTGQFLIGGTREDGFGDHETTVRHISAILGEALDVYPALRRQRVIRTFSGVRTATKDGLPIVGAHPSVSGLSIATGFEGDGICLGPLMGSVATDIVRGRVPSIDIGPFSPARFGESAHLH